MIHAFLPTSKVRVNKAHDSAWIALTPATISSICDRFDAQLLASGTAGSRLVVPPLRIHVLNQIWLI